MKTDGHASAKAPLGERLEQVIEKLPQTEVTLIEILGSIGPDGLMFPVVLLALVFLVPVSIPGVSTVFGSAILLIGVSHLFERKLWLPERIANRAIAAEKLAAVMSRALVWFKRFERFSRPRRLDAITRGGKIGLFNKLAFILAAGLLMAPFGFIPFSNTLPAVALICLAVGGMHKDGGYIFLGHLANLATLIYFTALITGGGWTVLEGLRLISG